MPDPAKPKGRPRVLPMDRTVTIGVSFRPSDLAKLRAEARARGVSVSQVVREAIASIRA